MVAYFNKTLKTTVSRKCQSASLKTGVGKASEISIFSYSLLSSHRCCDFHTCSTHRAYLEEDLYNQRLWLHSLVQGPSCEMIIESFHCCILVQRSSHECSQEDEEEYTTMSNTPNSFSISHQGLCPRTFLRSKSHLSMLSPDIAWEEEVSQIRKLLETCHIKINSHVLTFPPD